MTVKIRLARFGAKKKPYYRVVVANSDSPRDGKFLERVGTYNPILSKEDANRVILNQERIKHWLSVGAQPTERVYKFLEKAKLVKAKSIKRIVKAKTPINQPSENELKESKTAVSTSTEKKNEEGKTAEKKADDSKEMVSEVIEKKVKENEKIENLEDK